MTFLTGILFGARTAMGHVWGFIARHPLQAALIASLCLSAWLWRGKNNALAERDEARATIAEIRKAQSQASELQAAINAEPVRRSETIARITDATAKPYLDSVRRAAADRVQPAPRCAASVASVPGADSAAVGDVEDASAAGVVPDTVTVARSDWEQVAAAAGQAAMCVRAGQALIADGVAVDGPTIN